jgi:hypothetical protein
MHLVCESDWSQKPTIFSPLQAELQNNDMVIAALNGTIRTAMDIKSKHLRPEIRFLNKILLHGTPESRRPVSLILPLIIHALECFYTV